MGTGIVRVGTLAGGNKGEDEFRKTDVMRLRNYAEHSVWVRRGLDLHRQTIAYAEPMVVPADLSKPMDLGVKREIETLLKKPNKKNDSYPVIKSQFIEDAYVIGHGVFTFDLRNDLVPWSINVEDAANFAIVGNWDGNIKHDRYHQFNPQNGEITRSFKDDEVMVWVVRPRSYDALGLSHVELLDSAIRALLTGDRFLEDRVLNASPNGALNLGKGVGQGQVDEVRSQIDQVRRAFIVMGGTDGASYMNFNASAKDMQVLDTLVWFVREVCAIFGLSTPQMALSVDTSRANTDSLMIKDQESIATALRELRDLENRKIISTFGDDHNCKIDYPILNQQDAEKIAKVTQIQTAGVPWTTINEARRANGMDPLKIPFADQLLLPSGGTFVPLESLSNPQPSEGQNDDNDNDATSQSEPGEEQRGRAAGALLPHTQF
jgi:hypothetical protein